MTISNGGLQCVGVQLVPHYTHSRNKGDPKYGVQMLAPLWRVGRSPFAR